MVLPTTKEDASTKNNEINLIQVLKDEGFSVISQMFESPLLNRVKKNFDLIAFRKIEERTTPMQQKFHTPIFQLLCITNYQQDGFFKKEGAHLQYYDYHTDPNQNSGDQVQNRISAAYNAYHEFFLLLREMNQHRMSHYSSDMHELLQTLFPAGQLKKWERSGLNNLPVQFDLWGIIAISVERDDEMILNGIQGENFCFTPDYSLLPLLSFISSKTQKFTRNSLKIRNTLLVQNRVPEIIRVQSLLLFFTALTFFIMVLVGTLLFPGNSTFQLYSTVFFSALIGLNFLYQGYRVHRIRKILQKMEPWNILAPTPFQIKLIRSQVDTNITRIYFNEYFSIHAQKMNAKLFLPLFQSNSRNNQPNTRKKKRKKPLKHLESPNREIPRENSNKSQYNLPKSPLIPTNESNLQQRPNLGLNEEKSVRHLEVSHPPTTEILSKPLKNTAVKHDNEKKMNDSDDEKKMNDSDDEIDEADEDMQKLLDQHRKLSYVQRYFRGIP